MQTIVITVLLSLFYTFELKATELLPLVQGKVNVDFDTEGNQEGLLYLGSAMIDGTPAIYTFNQDEHKIYRHYKSHTQFLATMTNGNVVGFGTLENGHFLVLTRDKRGQYQIMNFNHQGTKTSYMRFTTAIHLDNDDLHTLALDGDYYIIQGPAMGYRVHRTKAHFHRFDGFAYSGAQTHENLNFYLSSDNSIDLILNPQSLTHLIFYTSKKIDNVSFLNNTGKAREFYFIIESQINLDEHLSSFYIYKVNESNLLGHKNMTLTLPYYTQSERHFWVDSDGKMHITIAKDKNFQVFRVQNF